jgi:hypothetical protein
VSVLVPLVQTSAAKVPKVVRDREALDQTANGIVAPSEVEAVKTVALVLLLIVVIAEAMVALTAVVTAAMFVDSDVEAASTVALVLLLTTPAIDEDAVPTILLVFALTAEVTAAILVERDVEALRTVVLTALVTAAIFVESEVEALVTSDCTAREPLESDAPVRVRVPLAQTSAARVPKVVRDLVAEDQTARGIAEASDDEAAKIDALVFVLIVVMLLAILAAREVEARSTVALVLALTAPVLLVILAASEVEAFKTVKLVFAFTSAVPAMILAASEVEALVTSDCTARDPDVSPAPVSVLVPLVQTSAASVPKVVRLRAAEDHTANGIVAPRDVDAVKIALLVFALIEEIADAT